jgi:hypothetical protein
VRPLRYTCMSLVNDVVAGVKVLKDALLDFNKRAR